MKVLYQGWSTLRRKVHTSENTIDRLDTVNKTKYLKIFKRGKTTIEEIARKNHEDGLMYEVVILGDLDVPANHLNIVHKNKFIGVSFLDNAGREYLTYHFTEIEPKKKLFLHEVWYNEYTNNKTEDMDYYIHFVFDREGNAAYRKYDEIAKKTIDYESSQPFDVSGLYEDYPEFGQYESLIRMERNIEILDNLLP